MYFILLALFDALVDVICPFVRLQFHSSAVVTPVNVNWCCQPYWGLATLVAPSCAIVGIIITCVLTSVHTHSLTHSLNQLINWYVRSFSHRAPVYDSEQVARSSYWSAAAAAAATTAATTMTMRGRARRPPIESMTVRASNFLFHRMDLIERER
eukprot:GHVU01186612.1.p1 GENE.GHVU01186612.1~~GHVU01186612.1.p1  ORF type:complete len:154 (-),score=5.05 GHVU01186612.1:772-1233(-)